MDDTSTLLDHTSNIITAFITKNSVPPAELPHLIRSVHTSLSSLGQGAEEPVPDVKTPAVSIKKSIGEDYLICLEDGRKFKSLKRHLRSKYNLTAEEYRAKWGLPKDYPMVAPSYSAARSALAKEMGLGAAGRAKKPAGRKPRKAATA